MNNYSSGRGFADSLPPAGLILDALDTIVRYQGEKDACRICLESVLDQHLKGMAASQAPVVREWILSLVASPKHRVRGAQQVAELVGERLRALSMEASESLQAIRQQAHLLEQSLRSEDANRERRRFYGFGSRRKPLADKRLLPYFRLRIEELTLNGVCRFAGLMLTAVATITDTLRNLAADLNRLAEGLDQLPQSAAGGQSGPQGSEAARGLIAETISSQKNRAHCGNRAPIRGRAIARCRNR